MTMNRPVVSTGPALGPVGGIGPTIGIADASLLLRSGGRVLRVRFAIMSSTSCLRKDRTQAIREAVACQGGLFSADSLHIPLVGGARPRRVLGILFERIR